MFMIWSYETHVRIGLLVIDAMKETKIVNDCFTSWLFDWKVETSLCLRIKLKLMGSFYFDIQ